jgi:hypothetical protein
MFSTVEVQAASCDDDVGQATIESIVGYADVAQLTLPGKEIFISNRYAEVTSTLNTRCISAFIKLGNANEVSRNINTQYFKSYLRNNLVRLDKNLTKLQDTNTQYFMSYLRNS